MAPVAARSPVTLETTARQSRINSGQLQQSAEAAVDKWSKSQQAVTAAVKRVGEVQQKLAQTQITTNWAGQVAPVVADLRRELGQLREKLPGLTRALETNRSEASRLVSAARQEAGLTISQEKMANFAAQLQLRPRPFPEASNVDSLDMLERLPPDVQKKLIGAVMVKDALGEASAQKVNQAAGNSAQAATLLAAQLKDAQSPGQRAELIAQSAPAIAQIARGINGPASPDATQAMISLGLATDAAGPAAAKALAAQLVAATALNEASGLARTIGVSVRDGAGAALGAEVVQQLRAAGKFGAAEQVENAMAKSLKGLHDDFAIAQKGVAKTDKELGLLLQGFGPVLTDKQLTDAVGAFKKQHAKPYKKVEEASLKLSAVIEGAGIAFANDRATRANMPRPYSEPGVLGTQAAKILSDLPALSHTDAGRELVAKALKEDGNGGSSFLHTAQKYATFAVKGGKALGGVTTVVTQVVAQQALDYAASGQTEHAAALFKGMTAHASAYGLKPEQMQKVMGKMDAVLRGEQGAVDALSKEMGALNAGAPSKLAMTSLKGLGIALAAVNAYQGFSKWGEQGTLDKIKASAAALKVGSDGALFALELLAKSKATQQLLKKTGAAFNTVVEGVSAYQDFSKGDVLKGSGDVASMIGGIMMVVPGWQVPGTLLSLGSMGLKHLASQRAAEKSEGAAEKDAFAFLKGAGIEEAKAKKLSDLTQSGHRNIGQFVVQLSRYLGMPPAAVFNHLASQSVEQLGQLVKRAKNIVPDDAGNYAKTASDDRQSALMEPMHIDGPITVRTGPQSLESMRAWMVASTLLPK